LEHPDGLRAGEALTKLRSQVKLTAFEKGRFEGGTRPLRFDQIVRFATIDASKAGWMVKQKGQWSVTEQGRAALDQFPDPADFFRRAKELYGEWKGRQPKSPDEPLETPEGGPEKVSELTFEQAQEQAWSEVEAYLRRMPPYDFQDLVASLL